MRQILLLLLTTGILACDVHSTNDTNVQISRYETLLNKKELRCFFSNFSKYLSNTEGKRLLGLQQEGINDLVHTWRYDEQYGIVVEQKKSDIDLTIFYNKTDPNLTKVYIAGISQPLDIALKEINKKCSISGWETPKERHKNKK